MALLAAALVLAAATAGFAWRHHEGGGAPPSIAAASPTQAAGPADVQALLATPQARAWNERRAFEREARAFVREAPSMPAPARQRRAGALQSRIDDEAAAGRLSAGERFLLEAALVRATTPEAQQKARLSALATGYRSEAARAEARWRARLAADPRYAAYKQREAEVVAEVMAMQAIPGGLDRDEYLRRRLQAERELAYR